LVGSVAQYRDGLDGRDGEGTTTCRGSNSKRYAHTNTMKMETIMSACLNVVKCHSLTPLTCGFPRIDAAND
jgi:hypothetical protein